MRKLLAICLVLSCTLLVGYNTTNPFMREEVVVHGGYAAGGAEIDNTGTGKFQEVVADTFSGTAIGTNVQAWDNDLDDLAGLTHTARNIVVSDGTDWTSRTMQAADVPTLNQNTTGSAAKWTTARNLAGNSVDGSADVVFSNKFLVQGTADTGLSGAQFMGALGTGIVKNTTSTGVQSIAIASDFPTLNQNTTGSAATLTTARAINGVDFNGSAAITVPVNNANSTTNADMLPLFTATAAGNYAALTNTKQSFNPSTGTYRADKLRVTDNATSTDLITNGTNEAASATFTGGTPLNVRATYTQSSDYAYAGTYSAKVMADGTAGISCQHRLTNVTPALWKFGAKYTASVYVYIPVASTCTQVSFVWTFNGTNYFSNAITTKGIWQLCTVTTITPVSFTGDWTAAVVVYGDTSLATTLAYFDNISILEYTGGTLFTGGAASFVNNINTYGKLTGGGTLGLDVDTSGNVMVDGDLAVNGGDVVSGVSGTTRGTDLLYHGAGGNTPGYTKYYSANGTAVYAYASADGSLHSGTTVPAADGTDLFQTINPASPPALGGTTPAEATFTTVNANYGVFGTNDTTTGIVYAYGNNATSGGGLWLYNGADDDGTYNVWKMVAGGGLNVSVDSTSVLTLAPVGSYIYSPLTTNSQLISTLATGTAPLSITSTTVVPNLNVSQLLGATWAAPGTIGSTTPNTGAFTTLIAGVNGTTRGTVHVEQGAAGNTPGYYSGDAADGTKVYANFSAAGDLHVGTSVPIADTTNGSQTIDPTAPPVFGYLESSSTLTAGTNILGGANDSVCSIITAYGGDDYGETGRVRIYNHALEDSTTNFWQIEADSGLSFQSDGTDVRFFIDKNFVEVDAVPIINQVVNWTTNTTPSVAGGNTFRIGATDWTAGNNITDFTGEATYGSLQSLEITIIGGDSDCVIVDGGNLTLNGNWTADAGATLKLIYLYDTTTWYELDRFPKNRAIHTVAAVTADDTTPSVANADWFTIPGTWTAGHDITDLDDGVPGQEVILFGGDADCNITDGGDIHIVTSLNLKAGTTIRLGTPDGTTWYQMGQGVND